MGRGHFEELYFHFIHQIKFKITEKYDYTTNYKKEKASYTNCGYVKVPLP